MRSLSSEPRSRVVRFKTSDEVQLAGDVFEPAEPARATLLIASAMGVRRQLYAGFASFLREAGVLTLTFDYRGIGEARPASLRGYRADLSDWAERDLPAAIAWLREQAPDKPLLYVGHSIGGQLLGLIPNADVHAALLIASQSGYWGHWPGAGRLVMAALWFAAVPAFSRAFGYLPMRAIGQGEDVPRGVATQWAAWGRDPRYIVSYLQQRDGIGAFEYDRPLRAYAFSDDRYAPRTAVQALLSAYPRANPELRYVRGSDLGVRSIGHFGAFRSVFRSSLWEEQRRWLVATL